ncbi:MAG: ABC transporter permease subunit [Clostridia bacterium]|jgi:putative aldouronate transport system permease protein|nr:ABC transporter permease subunit [Clostridia bacterium]
MTQIRAGVSHHENAFGRWLRSFTGYKKHLALTLMFLPVIVYFIVFKYIPMGGIVIAFKNYKIKQGIFGSAWCGLDNFTKAFATPTFARSVKNTLVISGLKLLFGFPAPILLALMLNEVTHIRFKKTVQTITYLPHFLSWVVLAGMFQQLLSPNNGAVNAVLKQVFGMKDSIYFLGSNQYFRGTLIVTDIWKNVGWSSILYLATISGIDPALYEAATVDGASRWQCTRYITLPSLVSTIVVMLILNIGSIMDAGFDQVFNLYNSAVYQTGDIIDTYVYRYGIGDMKYSLATAVGLFKNVIAFVLVVGTNLIARRISGEGIW